MLFISGIISGMSTPRDVFERVNFTKAAQRTRLVFWRSRYDQFFPNQAALEGFLQVGLRNRIGQLGGTGSPVLHFGGSPRCLSVPQ